MNKEFEKICRMSQKELKKYVKQNLQKSYDSVVCQDGFVYAEGNFPVLLVAHLDTVHRELPKLMIYDKEQNIISSPQGIGGDDKAGVYMVLEVIKRYNCSVLFCEDEEIGCIGSGKFAETKLAKELDFNYIIEFDRANANDAVFYQCANPDFEDFITKEFYEKAYGSFTDICEIAPVIGCAAVNLSAGYYNPHTTDEYVNLTEMEESIEAACKILERTTENDKFEYVNLTEMEESIEAACKILERTTENDKFEYIDEEYDYEDWGYANEYYEEKYYIVEYTAADGMTEWYDTIAVSREEAIGKFVIENPNVPYASVEDVWVDKESSKYL